MKQLRCYATGQVLPESELIAYKALKPEILHLIKKDFPDFSEVDYLSVETVNLYRRKFLESMLNAENREISRLEKEVINAIENQTLLSENIEPDLKTDLTFGQKLADKIAVFGGSWTFIIFFFSFLLLWMAVNIWVLAAKPFDPYPFILLNLILSCLAAIQAPIIMMSQNRQEQKDRLRSEHDYKINLKAELEIRLLHEKIDHLIIHQNKRLLDIQELQMDYLEELSKKKNAKKE